MSEREKRVRKGEESEAVREMDGEGRLSVEYERK